MFKQDWTTNNRKNKYCRYLLFYICLPTRNVIEIVVQIRQTVSKINTESFALTQHWHNGGYGLAWVKVLLRDLEPILTLHLIRRRNKGWLSGALNVASKVANIIPGGGLISSVLDRLILSSVFPFKKRRQGHRETRRQGLILAAGALEVTMFDCLSSSS